MRNFLKIQQILAIILVASLALAGASCKKKKDNPPIPDTPPTLPPIESLEMDFSDFNSLPTKGTAKIIEDTYVNYTVAHTYVSFWKDLLEEDLLAIPVAGLANALTKTGQEVSSDTFEWTLSFSAQSISYTGKLVAVKGTSSFTMELNIAPSSSPTSTFKYFDATVSNDLSSADWNIYKNSSGSVKVLDGLYSYNAISEFESLGFTYVEPSQTETNSSIVYNYVPAADYDGAFYMSMSDGDVDVEWDILSNAGRVMSLADFADSDWHCWNDVLADIGCTK